MIRGNVKYYLRWSLARLQGRSAERPQAAPAPTLYDHALQARNARSPGEVVAFWCPLNDCVAFNGFRYGRIGWHPFVATAREIAVGKGSAYSGSILQRFYESWQPTNAAEALIGCAPDRLPALAGLPSYAYILPWRSVEIAVCLAEQQQFVEEENLIARGWPLTISAGYPHHGPVSRAKGRLEYRRLLSLYRAIAEEGYHRERGHISVTLLQRGSEQRYLIRHGHHRTAVASALGVDNIPAVFSATDVVDVAEAERWPQVVRGVWPLAEAIQYLHHLFEFDSTQWARERGLHSSGVS